MQQQLQYSTSVFLLTDGAYIEAMRHDTKFKVYILKHFGMSPKNTEALKIAMEVLEMKPFHILNWASTRMGFLLPP